MNRAYTLSKREQEKILGVRLNDALTDCQIEVLKGLSEGMDSAEMADGGIGGIIREIDSIGDHRRRITKKVKMDFGKGSRKLPWFAGRYYVEIEELYNRTFGTV